MCKYTNWVVIIGIIFSSQFALGKFAMPQPIPGERIIGNVTQAIEEKPNDASLYYTLARTHYLMFTNKSVVVYGFQRGQSSEPTDDHLSKEDFDLWYQRDYIDEITRKEMGLDTQRGSTMDRYDEYSRIYEKNKMLLAESNWQRPAISITEAVQHAEQALKNFDIAINLNPKEGLYHLGKASLVEQYVEFLKETQGEFFSKPFAGVILDSAKNSYLTAYNLSIGKHLKLKEKPIKGIASLVGYEAGNAYIRLTESKTQPDNAEQKTIKQIKNNIAKLDKLPMGPITPIIFSLKESSSITQLLNNDIQVNFDLDGNGQPEPRPWLKPTTALLVWNPHNTNSITSGRQLFGTVSWRLFFDNGYNALNVLDDNRDGILAGAELEGICAWFDKNSNGISEHGEVVTLDEIGITEISTQLTGYDNNCHTNPKGIKTAGGNTLPTYDWIIQ